MKLERRPRIDPELWKRIGLAFFVLLSWALYFFLCTQPAGAPFIYADF